MVSKRGWLRPIQFFDRSQIADCCTFLLACTAANRNTKNKSRWDKKKREKICEKSELLTFFRTYLKHWPLNMDFHVLGTRYQRHSWLNTNHNRWSVSDIFLTHFSNSIPLSVLCLCERLLCCAGENTSFGGIKSTIATAKSPRQDPSIICRDQINDQRPKSSHRCFIHSCSSPSSLIHHWLLLWLLVSRKACLSSTHTYWIIIPFSVFSISKIERILHSSSTHPSFARPSSIFVHI